MPEGITNEEGDDITGWRNRKLILKIIITLRPDFGLGWQKFTHCRIHRLFAAFNNCNKFRAYVRNRQIVLLIHDRTRLTQRLSIDCGLQFRPIFFNPGMSGLKQPNPGSRDSSGIFAKVRWRGLRYLSQI
jgi:hypothetical protein